MSSTPNTPSDAQPVRYATAPPPVRPGPGLLSSEDWWAVWIGFALIGLVVALHVGGHPLAVPKIGAWLSNPTDSLPAHSMYTIGGVFAGFAALVTGALWVMGRPVRLFPPGFCVVFLLVIVAMLLGSQERIKSLGLEYELWAIVLGLIVSNTIGTPLWLLAGARSELFIKIGLVLMGAEILFGNIVELGVPGLVVAWGVTPIAVIFMYLFGTRFLKMTSRSLVMVIACATSVCGVSAAIASAAACRAKKEELTLAVGLSMLFTVLMMIGMPYLAVAMGLEPHVGGAWIGGTVDSTGAVAAAGAIAGPVAEKTAVVIKMIQNVLIGIIAFVIAVYWVSAVDRDPSGPRPSVVEVWRRFPKFVLGFLVASLLFSFVLTPGMGSDAVKALTGATKGLRSWWFALAFVSIGLESNFRQLAAQMSRGKPLVLYVVGQSFNIVLTLAAAYLAFEVLFKPAAG